MRFWETTRFLGKSQAKPTRTGGLAEAKAEVAGAELEEELLGKVNQLKEKIGEGKAYLQELADASDDRVEEIRARVAEYFDD